MTNEITEQLDAEIKEVEEAIFLCKDPFQQKQLQDHLGNLNKRWVKENQFTTYIPS